MKKYQVIIVLDETRERSYFYSYVVSEDSTKGNIECTELPPYADIDKARACYWDDTNLVWVYDDDKYNEICEKIEAELEAQEQAKLEASLIMNNAELTEAVMELSELIGGLL